MSDPTNRKALSGSARRRWYMRGQAIPAGTVRSHSLGAGAMLEETCAAEPKQKDYRNALSLAHE